MIPLYFKVPVKTFIFCLLFVLFNTGTSNAVSFSFDAPKTSKKEIRKHTKTEKVKKRGKRKKRVRKAKSVFKVLFLFLGAFFIGGLFGWLSLLGGVIGLIAGGFSILLFIGLIAGGVIASEDGFWSGFLWFTVTILFGFGFLSVFAPELIEYRRFHQSFRYCF